MPSPPESDQDEASSPALSPPNDPGLSPWTSAQVIQGLEGGLPAFLYESFRPQVPHSKLGCPPQDNHALHTVGAQEMSADQLKAYFLSL